jgi:hypothetical protein
LDEREDREKERKRERDGKSMQLGREEYACHRACTGARKGTAELVGEDGKTDELVKCISG